MLKQDFNTDFLYLIEQIFVKKNNLAFVRYNEWEYHLLVGKRFVGAWNGWRTITGSKLQKDLREAIQDEKTIDKDFIYWIASKQHREANEWYKNNIKWNLTFATLFVNRNYQYFKEILEEIKEEVVLLIFVQPIKS